MKLVELSNNILVNPEAIIALRGAMGADKRQVQVILKDGSKFLTSKDPRKLLRDIESAVDDKFDTFWAG